MAPAAVTDRWSNKAYATVTESAAATLTFVELQTNINVFDRQAWVVPRIEWYVPAASIQLLNASGDKIQVALCSSNKIADLGLDDPAVIDMMEVSINIASGVGFALYQSPFIRSFEQMPGGGLIVAPRPLYVAIVDVGAGAACTVGMRLYYNQIQLKAEEYLELVDFYRILT